MHEMASLSPLFAQANYEVLEGWNSFLWGSLDGTNTPLLLYEMDLTSLIKKRALH